MEAGLAPARTFKKPKGWNQHKKVMSPPDSWYGAVMPHLNERFYALMILLVTHGLRISEALRCTPSDIEDVIWPWRLNLPEYDKAGNPVQIVLASDVIEAIEAMPGWRERDALFGTWNRHNVKRAVQRACDKAGVAFYGSHAWGGHKANRNYQNAGGSLQGLMTAFRWKSVRMPLLHYGHEQKFEITERVHAIGRDWLTNLELQSAKREATGGDQNTGVNLGQVDEALNTAPQLKSKKSRKPGS